MTRHGRGTRQAARASAAANLGWSLEGWVEGGSDDFDDGVSHCTSGAETIVNEAAFMERAVAATVVTQRWHEISVAKKESLRDAEENELEAID